MLWTGKGSKRIQFKNNLLRVKVKMEKLWRHFLITSCAFDDSEVSMAHRFGHKMTFESELMTFVSFGIFFITRDGGN